MHLHQYHCQFSAFPFYGKTFAPRTLCTTKKKLVPVVLKISKKFGAASGKMADMLKNRKIIISINVHPRLLIAIKRNRLRTR